MPTPENFLSIHNEQRPLNSQLCHGKAAALNAFYPLQAPTAVSFSFAKMHMRWMRMAVREEEYSIATKNLATNTGIG
jgi:hypothetical protein